MKHLSRAKGVIYIATNIKALRMFSTTNRAGSLRPMCREPLKSHSLHLLRQTRKRLMREMCECAYTAVDDYINKIWQGSGASPSGQRAVPARPLSDKSSGFKKEARSTDLGQPWASLGCTRGWTRPGEPRYGQRHPPKRVNCDSLEQCRGHSLTIAKQSRL